MKKDFVNVNRLVSLGAIAMLTPICNALEIPAGDWTFSFGGYVNGHYTHVSCDDSGNTVNGNPLLCTDDDAVSVSNGYSPMSFNLGASTQRNGYDISVNLAIEEGSTDNAAFSGNDSSESDRAYFTIGNASMGTLKVGRDYGVFALDATLLDMSLGGVGAPASVRSPLNTSLGAAGYGYIFVDRLSQITYSYSSGAFNGVVGVFQPLDAVQFGGGGFAGDSGSEDPGLHGKLRLNYGAGFISTSFINQSVNNGTISYDAEGIDLTATLKLSATSFGVTAFQAEGLGYYGLLIDGSDSAGNPRDTDGWLAQVTHTFGDTKLGLNYGVSNVDRADNDSSDLVETSEKTTVGIYHTWVPGVTISAEYSAISSESHAGNEIENDAISVGFALAF